MKCLCPKCTASIHIDEPDVPEKGKFTNCPECNGKFWIHRESFALRAYKKDGKIFCIHCGEEPGPDIYCGSCFHLYPDYWAVHTSKPARQQARKASDSFRLPAKIRKPVVTPLRKTSSSPPVGQSKKTVLMPVISVVVALVLVLSAVSFYLTKQAEQAFADNFVLTLYGVKSGTDASFKHLAKLLETQKSLGSKEIASLQSIKSEIDQYRQKLESPPQQFLASTEKLSKYYSTYSSLHELAITSSGSSANLPDQIESMKDAVSKAETDLKKNISDRLLDQVQKVVGKYRNLQFMVK